MNFLKKWIIEKEITKMLGNLMSKVDGYKTYILAVMGIIVAIIGHFWGPITFGTTDIPRYDWGQCWDMIWKCALVMTTRSAIAKAGEAVPPTK